MKRVLVLDAAQRSALAVTRSLGMRGITVITADEADQTLAGSSRYSSSHCIYPSPRTLPNQFIESLIEIIQKENIEILLPMTELTTTLLLGNEALFLGAVLPFSSLDTVDSLANKCSLMRRAETLSIPIPRTRYANQAEHISVDLDDLPYPLVLKPGKSWLHIDNEWVRNSVRYADNALIAKEILASDPAFHCHPYMVQECVSGGGQGIFALYDKGKAIAFFAHRRLREKPPSGGVSVLSESVPVDPTLLSYARTLLDKASWHGVAMVEFKVDENNGTPYLMEVNTRFWGSLQLAIDAGVDFPWLLYQLACGESPDETTEYRKGVKLRWLLGDLDNLYLILRDRHFSVIEKLAATRRFLTPSFFNTRHEVNRWGDLGPFWFELKQYLRDLMR